MDDSFLLFGFFTIVWILTGWMILDTKGMLRYLSQGRIKIPEWVCRVYRILAVIVFVGSIIIIIEWFIKGGRFH